MFKWQFENLLKASSNPFFLAKIAAKKVKFLLDNITILNKILQMQIINKSQQLHHIKPDLKDTYL